MKQQTCPLSRAVAAQPARLLWQRRRGRLAGQGARQQRQRGIVLFFALIVLVILLIGGIAVVRMSNAALLGAGNLAFRRDLTMQSDVVIARAAQALATIPDKTQNLSSANYSAQILPVNAQGIPKALLTDSSFNGVGVTGNDFSAGAQNSGVTIRYVIERMCKTAGGVTLDNCVQVPGGGSGGGSASRLPPPARPSVIYRLSARVTGPRDTQAFFQTTLSGAS